MKKIIYYSSFPVIDDLLLYKEHGELFYYLSNIYGCNAIIDDYSGDKTEFRTVHLIQSNKLFRRLKQYCRIFVRAKKIDVLCVFLIYPDTLIKMLAYRLGGGKGKIYLKTDLGLYFKNGKDLLKWDNMNLFLKIFHRLFKSLPDVYSVETESAYKRLLSSYYSDLIVDKRLFLLPNGFDKKVLIDNNVLLKPISQKEKIIISVGRIGTYQKNTELLLEILSSIDLGTWKIYIIGPIEKSFLPKIDLFYNNNPLKRESVFFTGVISQKGLYDYYNRSRIFLLTSRSEGYAFALIEAAYMKNYIISTDVGGAIDVLKHACGYVVPSQSKEPFIAEIKRIVDMSDDELNNLVLPREIKEITWEYILKNNDWIGELVR